jgi:hypothetical protein
MRLVLRNCQKRTKERSCQKHPECSAVAGEIMWATLYLDEVYPGSRDPIVVHRCFKCLLELCDFTPIWGRVLKNNHVCSICGEAGKSIKFMTSVPYPGERKVVCVKCFERVGLLEEPMVTEIEGGGVIDQGQR